MTPPPSHAADATPRLTIDLGALADNYRFLAKTCAPARVAAVVKCDAYGLGAARVGPALRAAGCETFFVAHASEALALREAIGAGGDIFVLHGPTADTVETFAAASAVPVLNSTEQVALWRAAIATGAAAPRVAVHVDAGINRLGLEIDDARALAGDAHAMASLDVAVIMSHLSCSGDPDSPLNAAQKAVFDDIAPLFPGATKSLAAAAGALLGPEYRYDLVRAGIALYGAGPFDKPDPRLKTVVTAEAPILQIRDVAAGETVGYGATYRFDKPARIATIAVGYGDGYLRSLSAATGEKAGKKGGRVWIKGAFAPIVGRISMDLAGIDVTEVDRSVLRPGDMVELFGPNAAIEDVATAAETISYELLTNLGFRYRRAYAGDQA